MSALGLAWGAFAAGVVYIFALGYFLIREEKPPKYKWRDRNNKNGGAEWVIYLR